MSRRRQARTMRHELPEDLRLDYPADKNNINLFDSQALSFKPQASSLKP
jgi:hypothetical protein